MRRAQPRGAAASMLSAAAALVLALAGCGGAAPPPPVTGPGQTAARVGLIDFQIVTTAKVLAGGLVVLTVTNAGSTVHNLRVQGDHTDVRTALLAPGQAATLPVNLAGEHRVELTCTVPGHREQGMDLTLPVGPAP